MEQLEHLLRECLAYDPVSGKLIWAKPRARSLKPGDEAGSPARGNHLKFGIGGKILLVHRVCWFLHYGSWPVGYLDHVDGDGRNNRISNLREATYSENAQNRGGLRHGNLKGVSLTICKSRPFKAAIYVRNRQIHLGYFSTKVEAARAYDKAAAAHYGAFAKPNYLPEAPHA